MRFFFWISFIVYWSFLILAPLNAFASDKTFTCKPVVAGSPKKDGNFYVESISDESTPIVAIASGVVIYSDYSKELGNGIVIDHQNGYHSHYYHNEENFVKKNEKIDRGILIAKIGNTGVSTGPHLHFEIWKDGEPIDPLTFLMVI